MLAAEKIGLSNINQSEVGRVTRSARHLVEPPNPKKRLPCEEQLGFGTAKAVIASGAATVHASTLLTPLQELAARA